MTDTFNETIAEPLGTFNQKQSSVEWRAETLSTSQQNVLTTPSSPEPATADRHHPAPERRLNPRIEVIPQPVDVTLLENGVHRGTGRIHNISAHGMFVETNASFDNQEAHVKIKFRLPNNQHDYRTWGQVVHRTNNGIGIAADVLEPTTLVSLQAVEHYVEQNAE